MEFPKSKSGDNTPDDNKKVIKKNLSLSDLQKAHSFNRPDSSLQRAQSFSESHGTQLDSSNKHSEIKDKKEAVPFLQSLHHRLPLKHMEHALELNQKELDNNLHNQLNTIKEDVKKTSLTGDHIDNIKKVFENYKNIKNIINTQKVAIQKRMDDIKNNPG